MSYSSEVLADSPAWYPKLDETSGTVAVDASGNGRNGTYTPGITLGATSLLTDGSGKAAQFTANTSTGIYLTDAAWMDFTALTFECLVNFSSAVDGLNGDALISHYGAGGTAALLWRTTAGKLGLQVKVGGSIFNCNSTTSPSNGTTYHVAGTWDGSNARIYVNGTLEATTAASGSLATTSDDLRIGCYSNSASTVPGMVIDEPAVYPTALSGTRIGVHSTAAFSTASSASGTGSLSLSASGGAAAPGVGSGSLSLSGSGAATSAASGTASLSLSASGSITPPSPAAGAGSLSLSASGGASASPSGTASLDLVATGTALAILAASGTATLTLSASGSAVMSSGGSATLTLSAGGVAVALFETDLSNALDGLDLLLTATVTFAVPVAPPAPSLGVKYDKAIAYPVPTMVGSRPT